MPMPQIMPTNAVVLWFSLLLVTVCQFLCRLHLLCLNIISSSVKVTKLLVERLEDVSSDRSSHDSSKRSNQ